MPHNNRITISLSNNQTRQLEALKERTGITSTAVAVRVALDAWALSLPPIEEAPPPPRTERTEAEARAACIANGEDPDDWLDYADLRNGKKRWQYFV